MIKNYKPISCSNTILLLLLLLSYTTHAKSSGSSGGRSGSSSYSSRSSYYSGSSGGSDGPWWVSLIVIGAIAIAGGIIFIVVACIHGVSCCVLFRNAICCRKKELTEMRQTYILRRATLRASKSGVYDITVPSGFQQQPNDPNQGPVGPEDINKGEPALMPGYPQNNMQVYSYPPIQQPGLENQNQFYFASPPPPPEYFNQHPLNQGPKENAQLEKSSTFNSEVEIEADEGIHEVKENNNYKSPSKVVYNGQQLEVNENQQKQEQLAEPPQQYQQVASQQQQEQIPPPQQQINQQYSQPQYDQYSLPPQPEQQQVPPLYQMPNPYYPPAQYQSSPIYPPQQQVPLAGGWNMPPPDQYQSQQQQLYPYPYQQDPSQNYLVNQNANVPQAYPRPNQDPNFI